MPYDRPDPEPGITWQRPRNASQVAYYLDHLRVSPDTPAAKATIRLHLAGVWASYELVVRTQAERRKARAS